MKRAASLLLLLPLSWSWSALAKVTVNIPDGVDVLAVNAHKSQSAAGFVSADHEVLKNGVNQIVFKYSPAFTIGKDVKKAYSPVFIAKIKASNTTLNFQLPDYQSLTQANEQIDSMTWSLLDANGHNVVLAKDELKKNGIQFGRDYVAESKHYNENGGVAAILPARQALTAKTAPATTVRSTTATHQVATTRTVAPATSSNLTQLKLWYKNSSVQERKAFRKWIIDQE